MKVVLGITIISLALATFSSPVTGAAKGLPRLRAEGIRIVDKAGNPVVLRGINLGGWLLQEMWMCPFVQNPPEGSDYKRIPDHVTLWKTFEQRLGPKDAAAVERAWRNNWITEPDFARIKEAGFNHVRIPFLYSVAESASGMEDLRKAVQWAGDAGLYVILDMHGTPGSQSNDHTTGEAGRNRYFYDNTMVRHSERVWEKVAKEFGSNPSVAAFDLINEPSGAPNPATLHLVHNRLYQAVRKAAPDTIVIVEDGFKGLDTTPHADVANWTNVVYSIHIYHFDAKSPQGHIENLNNQLPRIKELRGYRNAPVYIGEFNIEPHSTAETMATYTKTLDDSELSWALWTYKTVAPGGPMGYWGLWRDPRPANCVDPFADSAETAIRKMTQYRTENLEPVSELKDVFRTSRP